MNQNRSKFILVGIFIVFVVLLILLLSQLSGLNSSGSKISIGGSVPGDPSWIIPDSELVYGPASVGFDIEKFIQSKGGVLSTYKETVGGVTQSAGQIITLISQDYSVNPRLLLVVIEQQSKMVTGAKNDTYPVGYQVNGYEGLYRQLSWAADQLNHGYYAHRVNALDYLVLEDGKGIYLSGDENSGTVGIYYLYSYLTIEKEWIQLIQNSELQNTYINLFGDPFQYAIEPLLPKPLNQPRLQLPFENGKMWSFTGGPHSAWGRGSAWAALDFAPPKDVFGCVESKEWVTAVADGVIARTGNGIVVLDLDKDGYEQTGWNIFYLHIASKDKIQEGALVKAGDQIGHPSCEGGISTGTHVHIARRYQGEWIPADQNIPFDLDGWKSSGTGIEYNGTLKKQEQMIEAMDGRTEENQISR